MILRKDLLLGHSIKNNTAPPINTEDFIRLQGTANGRSSSFGISECVIQKHLLLMGGTGSGKTNSLKLILPQIQNHMNDNDIALVFDSKLDFDAFHADSDYVISCRDDFRGCPAIWNIFMDVVADGWSKSEISSNADEIAEVIFADALISSSQPFFPRAARDIFAAVVKAMAFIGIADKQYRIQYMNNQALIIYLSSLNAQKLQEFLTPIPELTGVLKYVGDGRSEQSLGVFAELQSVVSKVFSRFFSLDGRFSVRKAVKERGGKTLFIEYDPSKGKSLQPVYQVLVDLFLKEALSTSKKSSGRVFVICDELKMLPHLNHFEDALNFGRSLGVAVIAGIQSMQQLYEVYGEYGAKNIASAFQSIMLFRTNDEASRSFVKSIFGKNVTTIQYMTPSGKAVEEKVDGYCVEDWDILDLHCGEAIIGLPYIPPFRFQFRKY